MIVVFFSLLECPPYPKVILLNISFMEMSLRNPSTTSVFLSTIGSKHALI